ncbi:MAG: thioredoxin family protein [Candidatus Diapherotrites archaeon]|nr:thioredoxin family protein [Candidatus Diapherotrites archaeon]
MAIGSNLPFFDLPSVDGRNYSPKSFEGKNVLAIIFTCNHCPYAQAYQERIKAIQKKFSASGAQVVAINSNDAVNYPDDSFPKMVERAKEKRFNFPYLRDESQEVARVFGAQVTPDCFVFDKNRKLVYRGRVDDNWQNEKAVTSKDLENAIAAAIEEKKVSVQEASAIGCSIKWKNL